MNQDKEIKQSLQSKDTKNIIIEQEKKDDNLGKSWKHKENVSEDVVELSSEKEEEVEIKKKKVTRKLISQRIPYILQSEISEVKLVVKSSFNDLSGNKMILNHFILEEEVGVSYDKNVNYFYVQKETICKNSKYLFENINKDTECS